nr:hypothetical protein [Aeromonas sp.]
MTLITESGHTPTVISRLHYDADGYHNMFHISCLWILKSELRLNMLWLDTGPTHEARRHKFDLSHRQIAEASYE